VYSHPHSGWLKLGTKKMLAFWIAEVTYPVAEHERGDKSVEEVRA
jgi:hypothetical protein